LSDKLQINSGSYDCTEIAKNAVCHKDDIEVLTQFPYLLRHLVSDVNFLTKWKEDSK